jgi:hypothetical protein
MNNNLLQSLTDDSVQWSHISNVIADHVVAQSPSRTLTALCMMRKLHRFCSVVTKDTMFEVLDINKPNLKNYESIQSFLGDQLADIADREPDTQLASVAGYLYGQSLV